MARIAGTTGSDTLVGLEEDDLINGDAGDDFIQGNGGNDTINGGAGDDNIFGGEGDDLIDGGDGNDIMTGGAGNDTLIGGAGDDQFYDLTVGDRVHGGAGFNTLFVNNLVPRGGRYEIVPDADTAVNGRIDVYDGDDALLGNVTYTNVSKIDPFVNTPPCFTPGTLISTPKGETPVEALQVGDRVITRDSGVQQIRWIGRRNVASVELSHAPHLMPIRIAKGALGRNMPERDMLVSPNHRVLVATESTALYFDEREVLVAAKHLTHMDGVEVCEVVQVTYIHVMFDYHEVILSDGAWTESFQPGPQAMAGLENAQLCELVELFPELATTDGVEAHSAARRTLKPYEASLLAV